MNRRYFAYGSNLDFADWHRWCRRHGLREGLLQPLFRAFLPDRALAFTRRSDVRRGGVLDVVHRPGHLVEGVVFAVAAEGWGALERKEGAPVHYRAIDTEVLTGDGIGHAVRTFEVVPGNRVPHVEPHADYLAVVRQGFRAFGLATEALDAAATGEPPASLLANVFTYGTLMRGESRGGVLGDEPPAAVAECRAPGRLFDLGDYPGMRPAPRRRAWVVGELRSEVDGSALEALDGIERFPGFGEPGGLFRRRLTEVGVADGRIERAWVYMLANEPDAPRIASGDWRARRRQ
jgi:gamma-glutamylcyclotransferase (GGCT)/AIG2-like uncharacterized protein YtfP